MLFELKWTLMSTSVTSELMIEAMVSTHRFWPLFGSIKVDIIFKPGVTVTVTR